MLSCYCQQTSEPSIPINICTVDSWAFWFNQQDEFVKTWINHNHFIGKPSTFCLIPKKNGEIASVILGLESVDNYWCFGMLPTVLPAGYYYLETHHQLSIEQQQRAILAWGLGSFSAKSQNKDQQNKKIPQLILSSTKANQLTMEWVKSIYWVRTLINLSSEQMGPTELVTAAKELQIAYDASLKVYQEGSLIEAFPAIYAVGRASPRGPRLLDLTWGDSKGPKLTLVGKGVCFDTGGLNLKTGAGMRTMKKDMAGAAHVLGLARMIMQQALPIQLRVLIPAVENVVSGNSIKPGDVINTRKGLRVEIGNTDAEGRLILCDALTAAVEEKPDLLIDLATLTGAARVALGPEVPVYFSNNEDLAIELEKAAVIEQEPLWRLPLYQPYKRFLKSEIADCNNVSSNEYGGAITAALYLQQFVPDEIPWAHFDLMAWNDQALPGRPLGGEAMALRTLFTYLMKWCSQIG